MGANHSDGGFVCLFLLARRRANGGAEVIGSPLGVSVDRLFTSYSVSMRGVCSA